MAYTTPNNTSRGSAPEKSGSPLRRWATPMVNGLKMAVEKPTLVASTDIPSPVSESQPSEIASGESWRLLHLPTHEVHFYDVHRLEFTGAGSVELPTDDSCQVLSLVEGDEVVVEAGGMSRAVRYAETFVVPAAAGSFTLHSAQPAKVLTAFIKKGRGPE